MALLSTMRKYNDISDADDILQFRGHVHRHWVGVILQWLRILYVNGYLIELHFDKIIAHSHRFEKTGHIEL